MSWIENKRMKMQLALKERDLRYKLLVQIIKRNDIPEDIKNRLEVLCMSDLSSDLVLAQEIMKTL